MYLRQYLLQNRSNSCPPDTQTMHLHNKGTRIFASLFSLPAGNPPPPCCSGGFMSVPCCRHYWLWGNISQGDIRSPPRLQHHRCDTEWRTLCFQHAEKWFWEICHTCLAPPAGFCRISCSLCGVTGFYNFLPHGRLDMQTKAKTYSEMHT